MSRDGGQKVRLGAPFGWGLGTMDSTSVRRSPRLHVPPPEVAERYSGHSGSGHEREREREQRNTMEGGGSAGIGVPQFQIIDLIFLIFAVLCVGMVAFAFGQIPGDWWGKPLFLSVIGLMAGVALVFDSVVLAQVAAKRYSM